MMMVRKIRFILLGLLLIGGGAVAEPRKRAQVLPDFKVTVTKSTTPGTETTRFKKHTPIFFANDDKKRTKYYTVISGTVKKGTQIYLGNKQLKLTKLRRNTFRFNFAVPLKKQNMEISVAATYDLNRDAVNKKERQLPKTPIQLKLEVPEDAWKKMGKLDFSMKRNYINFGLGPTYLLYTETGKPIYASITTTAKISYAFKISKNWDIAGNVFGNVLPLTTTITGVDMRVIGANLRIGYRHQFFASPWTFSLMAGYYYFTMLATDQYLGFANMGGPQLYPVVSRVLNNGHSFYIYAKISPVFNGSSFDNPLTNRELALGGGFAQKLKSGYQILYMIDLSNLAVEITQVKGTASSISLSIGFAI